MEEERLITVVKKPYRFFKKSWHRYVYEWPSERFRRKLAESGDHEFCKQAQQLCGNGLLILPSYFAGDTLKAMQDEFLRGVQIAPKNPDNSVFVPKSWLTECPVLSRAAVDPYLLGLVSYYWGKPVFLSETVGTRTEPVQLGDYSAYQWHHDAKNKQVKIMILLVDVPVDGQRMDYLPGTHKIWHDFGSYGETRFKPEYVKKFGQIVSCAGPAGTVIIFDTNGFHRGNRNLSTRRDIWTFFYTAGHALFPIPTLHRSVIPSLSAEQRRVVRMS